MGVGLAEGREMCWYFVPALFAGFVKGDVGGGYIFQLLDCCVG